MAREKAAETTAAERPTRSSEAFFGRRKGPPLHGRKQRAIEETLPRLRLDLDRPAPADLRKLFENDVDEIRLEIGFGGGEHLLEQARAHPSTGFIGVEPFVNGMAKLLARVEEDAIGNIRVYDDDATRLLDWLPPASLTRIDLLYPDPWPKKKHWKRRFVNQTNLDRFARVLGQDGLFRFASDIDTYVNWTLQHVHTRNAFRWVAERPTDWREPWEGWSRTRYEAKAIREGRPPAYLRFRKAR